MLTYVMDERGDLSLYEYLYVCIKNDILSDKLEAGTKLPSKRSLAKNLGLSVITVENAYSQLIAEGFIYSEEKKGYYVAELSKGIINGQYQDEESEVISIHDRDNTSKTYIADFVNNAVNYEKFPFSQWSKLTRKILSEENAMLLMRAPMAGVYELRKAISDYLYNFRGLRVSEEQIVVGSGTEYLYGILIQLLGREKIYAMEDPGYSKVSHILEGNGMKCEHIPIDSDGMMTDILRASKADIVHLTPAHHFPTGIVMPIKRRLEFLEWAYENSGRYIIEDDYDCEFRLQGRPIQTLFEADKTGRVIYMNTFSKTLAPSFRISYMVLPEHLLKTYNEKMSYISCTVPNLEQYVLAEFISGGYFERHINRMRVFYRNQRNILLEAVKQSSFAERVTILEEHAGLHFLMKIDTGLSDSEIVQIAGEKGVRISCLSDYCYQPREGQEHTLILNYSGLDRKMINDAVRVLGEIVDI